MPPSVHIAFFGKVKNYPIINRKIEGEVLRMLLAEDIFDLYIIV